MKRAIPTRAALNDPVVVDGTKYRIWGFVQGESYTLVLRDRFTGRQLTGIPEDGLVWDARAGVWRVKP